MADGDLRRVVVKRGLRVAFGVSAVLLGSCGSQARLTDEASTPVASISEPPAGSSQASSSVDVQATVDVVATTDEAVSSTVPTTVVPTVADSSVGDDTAPAPVEYEAITGVLQSSDHGPELCLGGMKLSLPPQCGGIGLTNWDWSAIDNVQTANGTTWVDSVVVVGRFDGPEFTITESHTPTGDDLARFRPTYTQLQTPCSEPAGGWLAQASNAPIDGIDMNSRVGEYVASQPDFAAWWVDRTINPAWNDPVAMQDPTALNDPRRLIVVATFTGDLERHETELRQLWPGALCVGLAAISQHDLDVIAAELFDNISNGKLALPNGVTLDLLSFSQSGNGSTGSVNYDVVVADPATQTYLDETYGPGRVVLTGALRPVAGQ